MSTHPMKMAPAPLASTRVSSRQAGLFASATALFLVAANAPYAWLIAHFGYDDILREPGEVILHDFAHGGPELVLAWLLFATGALLFVPVVITMRRLLAAQGIDDTSSVALGIGSAIAQATGLLRWVLVVPALAAVYVDPVSSETQRLQAVIAFDVVHRFGGMVIGETIGQLLLAGWTALTVMHLSRTRLLPPWLLGLGALTPPLWLVGQTESLHSVIPAIPSIETTPMAFVLWEAWLGLVAAVLLFGALLRPAASVGRTGP